MHITILAGGSRGDVQPYVALGKGLQTAGHTVRLLSSDDFHDLIMEHGLDFATTGGSSQAVARDLQALVEQGKTLNQHVTGYWFLEPPTGWEPPDDLLHFLQSGSPPLYI